MKASFQTRAVTKTIVTEEVTVTMELSLDEAEYLVSVIGATSGTQRSEMIRKWRTPSDAVAAVNGASLYAVLDAAIIEARLEAGQA
jgi:hypothetical protein